MQNWSWLWCSVLAVALFLSPPVASQQLLAPVCNEIFLTIDQTTATGPLLGLFQGFFVRQNENFDVFVRFGAGMPLVGFGDYGPIFEDGDYLVEHYWFSSSGGNMGGIMFTDINGRFAPPNIGPNDNFGVRFTRADGGMFSWVGIGTYSDLGGDILYGFDLDSFSDIANFQRLGAAEGIVLGQFTAGFLNFEFVPGKIAEIHFLDIPSISPMSFVGNTFSVTAPVNEIDFLSGVKWLSPANNPFMIDGSVTISGTNLGSDQIDLTDFSSNDAQLTLNSSATGSWTTDLPLGQVGSSYQILSGLHRHRPRRVTDLDVADGVFPDLMPTGDPIFDAVKSQISGNDQLYFSVRTDLSGGPRLNALFFEDRHRPADEVHTGSFVIPGGGLEFAAVNFLPGDELYNLFALSSTGFPLGSGNFFGITFGASQLQQVLLPLGVGPIHVLPSPDGVYEWGVPAGTFPPGLIIDGVSIAMSATPGAPFRVSPVARFIF